MKTISALFAAVIISLGVFAQSPQKLSYQAVIRNTAGKLIQESDVGLRFTILQGLPTGSTVYAETQTARTNINGLLTVEIGSPLERQTSSM